MEERREACSVVWRGKEPGCSEVGFFLPLNHFQRTVAVPSQCGKIKSYYFT